MVSRWRSRRTWGPRVEPLGMFSNVRSFARTYLAIGIGISLLAAYQTQVQTEALLKLRTRYKWAVLIGVFMFYAAAGLYLVLRGERTEEDWERLQSLVSGVKWARLAGPILVLLAFPVVWYARLDFYGRGLDAFFRLMWLFWALILVQALGWKLITQRPWPLALALAVLFDGLVAQVYTALLPVTDYPFSAGWSEASRFYYASLPFSSSVYGERLPLSVWHGTRYFLQSIPFIVPGLPLWFHRLWQALLWLGISGLTSWSLIRRLHLKEWAAA